MTNHNGHHRQDRRIRIATMAITGVIAGLTRAIVDALLRYLTTGY